MKIIWESYGTDNLEQVVSTYDVYDYDGNGYNEVVIGAQTWLVEPLRATHLANGSALTYITTDDASSLKAYRIQQNDLSNREKFGCLYNIPCRGETFINGYHTPTKAEIQTLASNTSNSSYKIRATGTTYWCDTNGTDNYGFNLRGGGFANPGFDKFDCSGDKYFDGWTSDKGLWIVRDAESSIAYYDAGTSSSYYMGIRLIKD